MSLACAASDVLADGMIAAGGDVPRITALRVASEWARTAGALVSAAAAGAGDGRAPMLMCVAAALGVAAVASTHLQAQRAPAEPALPLAEGARLCVQSLRESAVRRVWRVC
eukprot:TRINITY_DN7444_c0_g2_i8.p3 TRINITY_DN7444_c0_g2~~TRINITY_DN7444_c0_g2_i8.p3  ORF type:complete len:111 (-),score=30.53 TRINITY_DN7444_c0_g2_i8:29-361(-)